MKKNKMLLWICCLVVVLLAGCQETKTGQKASSFGKLVVGEEYAAYVDENGNLHILYDDAKATEGVDLEKSYKGLGEDGAYLVTIDENGTVWSAYPYTAEEVEQQLEELLEDAAAEGGNVGTGHGNPDVMQSFQSLSGVKQIMADYPYHYMALLEDGTLLNENGTVFDSGSGIVQFAQDENGAVLCIKQDGSLAVEIYDPLRKKTFANWEGVFKTVCAGDAFVVLKEDGTVIAEDTELNHFINSQENWENIVDVAAAGGTVVGLKNDGTVVAVCKAGTDKGQCEVEEWNDIVAIGTNGTITIGINKDGSLVKTK